MITIIGHEDDKIGRGGGCGSLNEEDGSHHKQECQRIP